MSILIKSSDRMLFVGNGTNTSSHNFNIRLQRVIEGTYLVKHAFVPNTMYNVHSRNNQFKLISAVMNNTITLTPGNYTSTTFAAEIKTQLEAQGDVNSATVTISTSTGKLNIIVVTAATEVGVSIFFPPSLTSDGESTARLLGVSTNAGRDFTNTAGNTWEVTGNNVIHLNYAVSVGIKLSNATNANYENVGTGNGGQIYLPMNLDFGYYKSLSSGDFTQHLHFKRANNLKIQVVDTSTGSLMDLNGGEFEILLEKVDY